MGSSNNFCSTEQTGEQTNQRGGVLCFMFQIASEDGAHLNCTKFLIDFAQQSSQQSQPSQQHLQQQ